MSFNDDLKRAHQQSPRQEQQRSSQPQRPGQYAGPAPETEEEVALIRQNMELDAQQKNFNRQRIEALSATIFARMVGGNDVLDKYCTVTKEGPIKIDTETLNQYFYICNIIAAEAAMSHANQVWGVPCERTNQNEQPPAQQQQPIVPPQQ